LRSLILSILFLNGLFGYGQTNPCETLDSLYRSESPEKAFAYLETNTAWPCDYENFKVLKAKVLIENYRFNEAAYELADLENSEATQLTKRIEYLVKVSSKKTGANPKMSSANAYGSNNLKLNVGGIYLADTQFVQSEFPLTVWSEKVYLPKKSEEGKLNQWLLTENFTEILPGSSISDSVAAITVKIKRPFKESKYYEIALVNLFKQQLIKTWNASGNAHTMYPCMLDDKIIFASDRAGGEGGFDLWSVEWNGKEFGSVENLGSDINTAANEIYPVVDEGLLIFASDRPDMTFGGFDLFSITESGEIVNPGLLINSSSDDMNPIVQSGRITSVSSNRDSATLMLYDIAYLDTNEVFAELFGRIKIDGLNMAGRQLTLSNEDSTLEKTVLLDKDGYFRINQLKGLENYSVSISGLEIPESEGRMTLFNNRGDLVADVKMNRSGVFVFKLLKPQDYYLEKQNNQDESILAVDIKGLFESPTQSEFVIALENSDGDLIGLTKTDESGHFIFESVTPDERYTIRTEVKNPNGLIRILNEKGEEIQVISPEDQNGYVHLRLEESDRVITITDEANRPVKISELETFNLPTVYFGTDNAQLSEESKKRLSGFLTLVQRNPEINIEIMGHTDSRGEKDYNLNLSQKRVESVLDFLIHSGVKDSRISGKGYGESRLKNQCSDGTPCSEEQHAVNRRTELRIYQNQSQLEP